MIMIIIDASAP